MRIPFALAFLALAGCSSSSPVTDGGPPAPADASNVDESTDGGPPAAADVSIVEASTNDQGVPETSLHDGAVGDEAAPEASSPEASAPDASDIDGSRRDGGVTTAPWPESCVPAANLPNPADAFLLTGPSGSRNFGEPARVGEAMSATLNGFPRTFDRFGLEEGGGVAGHGYDGSFFISLPSLAPGTYTCPDVKIRYTNAVSGPREFNSGQSADCCTVQVTRNGGLGGLIEGTFSGIVILEGTRSWFKIEAGQFALVLRPGDGGVQ